MSTQQHQAQAAAAAAARAQSVRSGGGYSSQSGQSGATTSSHSNHSHGFGPGGKTGTGFSGIVQGGAPAAGASASVPTSNVRDVTSGGIGAEYGPYSHIRGNSINKSPLAQRPPMGGAYSQNSGGSIGSGSSNHSGSGLLNSSAAPSSYSGPPPGGYAPPTNAGMMGPRFKGAAAGGPYSNSSGSGSLGSGNEKRSSAHSSVYSDAGPESPRFSGPTAGPTAVSGLLWDGKEPEVDDYLHNPDPKRDAKADRACRFSIRGILNVLALLVLVLGLLTLFAGYPIIAHFVHAPAGTLGGFGLGGTNGTGQVAMLGNVRNLIDPQTPDDVKQFASLTHPGTTFDLVFSDEFNEEGRTFWPGDDPYWEGVDIWYGATGDYEWYSPEAINTTGGALTIVMTERETHNLNFQSGMLQSWNKFCFQGGVIEMAAMLPGRQDTRGFWPGLWTMGNLGRPGYLGSTEGMWPYSYNSCDFGTLPNQTNPQQTGPPGAVNANGPYSAQYDGKLSFLPGQRASACTCSASAGEHPGPNRKTGRSAPEIDILEAQNSAGVGEASQSLQTAPYDDSYNWTQSAAQFFGETIPNTYTGAVYQEAVSGVAPIPAAGYTGARGARYVKYAFEYQPDWNNDGNGYITWYIDGVKTWTVTSASVPARAAMNIGRRLIPTEPMSIIINLGISSGFQTVHWDELTFPAVMKVDYVRVFQLTGQDPKTSCDPPDHPTADYIAKHPDVYANNNYTVFPREKYGWPKNSLVDNCT